MAGDAQPHTADSAIPARAWLSRASLADPDPPALPQQVAGDVHASGGQPDRIERLEDTFPWPRRTSLPPRDDGVRSSPWEPCRTGSVAEEPTPFSELLAGYGTTTIGEGLRVESVFALLKV